MGGYVNQRGIDSFRLPGHKTRELIAKLRLRRIKLGYTQCEVANMIKIDSKSLSRIETNNSACSIEKMSLWADVLGYKLELVERELDA